MRECLLAGNERDFTRLDLGDAAADLRNLGLRDVFGNVVGKAFDNALSEFGAFWNRKLLRSDEEAVEAGGAGGSAEVGKCERCTSAVLR